jgi:hypothetical protein
MIEDQDNLIQVDDKVLISLDSRNATIKNNGYDLSDLTFKFIEPFIQPQNAVNIKASILSFTCPNSQYVINSTNENFYLTLQSTLVPYDHNIILLHGNYNASSFITMFLNQLNTYVSPNYPNQWSMDIDTNTYHYTLYNSHYQFTIHPFQSFLGNTVLISRIGDVIGFDNTQTYISTLNASNYYFFEFPFPCNFGGLNSFNIRISNIKTHSLQYINGTNQNILNSTLNTITNNNIAIPIPVNCEQGQVIYFSKSDNFDFSVQEEIFDKLDIQLTDDLGNFLQLNNQNWNMTIAFTITRLQHRKTRNFFEIIKNPFPQFRYEPQY